MKYNFTVRPSVSDSPRSISELETLRKKVRIYEAILNSIHEGVLVTDPSGHVMFYNCELATFEGIEPKDAVGKHISELYQLSSESSEHLLVSQTGKPIPETYQRYFTKEGREVNSVAATVPVMDKNEVMAVYSLCRDVTNLKEMLVRTIQIQDRHSEKREVITQKQGASYTFDKMIGNSKALQSVIDAARRTAQSSANILIYGETGTGKELLVQSIHNASPNRLQPFVALNCAAIPENLLETMLFGAVKGAYTGAVSTVGLFEYVGEGTLYLDEINSMSLTLQAKLLRTLQERNFRKVGNVKEIPLRCRIISSINIDPMSCLRKHLLREDLFYRLSVITLYLPPLRERTEDIPVIIDYFIKKHTAKYYTGRKALTPELLRAFQEYRWSGNIRELENAIESMVCISGKDYWLGEEYLPPYLNQQMKIVKVLNEEEKPTLKLSASLQDAENIMIINALDRNHGNVSKAAKELGILRQSLQYRIKKLGLDLGDYRSQSNP